MSKERELLKECFFYIDNKINSSSKNLLARVDKLLAQPEQEPIGEIALSGNTTSIGAPFPAVKWITGVMPAIGTKIYTAPQKREPLSDERLRDISNSINATYDFGNISVWQAFYIARLIEKEHDIGGGE